MPKSRACSSRRCEHGWRRSGVVELDEEGRALDAIGVGLEAVAGTEPGEADRFGAACLISSSQAPATSGGMFAAYASTRLRSICRCFVVEVGKGDAHGRLGRRLKRGWQRGYPLGAASRRRPPHLPRVKRLQEPQRAVLDLGESAQALAGPLADLGGIGAKKAGSRRRSCHIEGEVEREWCPSTRQPHRPRSDGVRRSSRSRARGRGPALPCSAP